MFVGLLSVVKALMLYNFFRYTRFQNSSILICTRPRTIYCWKPLSALPFLCQRGVANVLKFFFSRFGHVWACGLSSRAAAMTWVLSRVNEVASKPKNCPIGLRSCSLNSLSTLPFSIQVCSCLDLCHIWHDFKKKISC